AAPVVPSVEGVWKAADWLEREQFDLLGVQFQGHPDLRRIMLPDDWVGHQLRKDYTEGSDYHHMSTTRERPLDGFVRLDEVMKRAIPEVGYLHRSLEKIGEKVTYNGYMPYTDRVDYITAMCANQGYAMAVERLLGVTVPKRAEYCRTIATELNRISSHLISAGTMSMDIGAVTPFPYALREREFINDLLE